jgi:hypothetical protein
MAVDLMDIKVTPLGTPFCASKGEKALFQAFQVDLSKPGRVTFPIWFRQPLVYGDCVFWAKVETSRDNAVYLCKQSLYNMIATILGNEAVAPYVPADVYSGNWDCNSAAFGLQAYQAAIQSGLGDINVVALDGVLFAYLLTNSAMIQQLAQNAFQSGIDSAGWTAPSSGQPEGVVPVPLTDQGSAFVPLAPPAGCTGAVPRSELPVPGTQPGTVPGTGGATPGTPGTQPVGYEEPAKKTSYVVPALVVGGLVLGVGALVYFGGRKPRPAMASAEGEEDGMLSYESCGCGGQ